MGRAARRDHPEGPELGQKGSTLCSVMLLKALASISGTLHLHCVLLVAVVAHPTIIPRWNGYAVLWILPSPPYASIRLLLAANVDLCVVFGAPNIKMS